MAGDGNYVNTDADLREQFPVPKCPTWNPAAGELGCFPGVVAGLGEPTTSRYFYGK